MAGTAAPGRRTRRRGLDPAQADQYRDWLRQMLLIRRFEEKAGEAYSLGKIAGAFLPHTIATMRSPAWSQNRKLRSAAED